MIPIERRRRLDPETKIVQIRMLAAWHVFDLVQSMGAFVVAVVLLVFGIVESHPRKLSYQYCHQLLNRTLGHQSQGWMTSMKVFSSFWLHVDVPALGDEVVWIAFYVVFKNFHQNISGTKLKLLDNKPKFTAHFYLKCTHLRKRENICSRRYHIVIHCEINKLIHLLKRRWGGYFDYNLTVSWLW
jgi:hypothetical protein